MAMYHFGMTNIKRSEGNSVVAKAAYILKERLCDRYTGIVYNFKPIFPIFTEIALPTIAPSSFSDPQVLLDALNVAESRSDAQMARLFVLSLPLELDADQHVELVRNFAHDEFVKKGQAVLLGIHWNEANSKGREALPARVGPIKKNPHAHLIVPYRRLDAEGFMRTKTDSRRTNNPGYLIDLRKTWAEAQNRFFEREGLNVRVSSESLLMQGIYRKPAKYLDRVSFGSEIRGIRTPAGELYREAHRARMRESHDREFDLERTI